MSKIIIGLTGLIASGKDVSKKHLEDKHGASSHRFSFMLRDILKRLYLPISRENMQSLSFDLRRRFGEDTLARVIVEDVKNDDHDIVVIDGIRRLADITGLKNLPNFYLLSIDADAKIRYDRLIKRNENIGDANKTFEQFLEEEGREAEQEIPTVMQAAQFKVNNESSLEDLYQQLDKIILKIRSKSETSAPS